MRPWGALLGFLVLVSAGCTTTLPGPEARRTSEKIDELEARVLRLQRQAAVNELELARLRQQVSELEARAGISGSSRSARAEPMPPAPRPATPPSGAILEEDDLEIPPMEPLRPPASEPAPPSAAAPAPASGAGRPLPPVSREAQMLYDQGYTLYHQGRYVEAEARFQEFLGEHSATELSDNAQYWIGAARLARGDHAGALAAFRLTVERFPQGNKVPDALFKIGECLEELGDSRGAMEVYRELERRFPHTAAATLAAERLSLLAP